MKGPRPKIMMVVRGLGEVLEKLTFVVGCKRHAMMIGR